MTVKKKRLGRGLDALLSKTVASTTDTSDAAATTGNQLRNIPLEQLQRGQYQPRLDMRLESLQELAESIKAQGVVQPIVVRPLSRKGAQGQLYEIIAGERRWRAAQIAELDTIPAVIRDVADEAAIAMSLIENIQRENLNPVEEARALERLIREFDVTHQEAATAVGRSRAAVSNLLRLLELSDKVKAMLENPAAGNGSCPSAAGDNQSQGAAGRGSPGGGEANVCSRDRALCATPAGRRGVGRKRPPRVSRAPMSVVLNNN